MLLDLASGFNCHAFRFPAPLPLQSMAVQSTTVFSSDHSSVFRNLNSLEDSAISKYRSGYFENEVDFLMSDEAKSFIPHQ